MKLEQMLHAILQNEDFAFKVREKKQEFLEANDPKLELSEADFLGLAFMAPAVSVAGADGKFSWFERRYLDKKSREYSKGLHLFFMDPVVKAVGILSKNMNWEDELLGLLKEALAYMEEDEQIFNQMKEVAQSSGGLSTVANVGVFIAELYFLGYWAFLLNPMHGPMRFGKASLSDPEKEKIKDIIQKLDMSDSTNYEKLEEYLNSASHIE